MKFLIIRLSSLGDIIHTLPVLNALRKSYPNAQIDWLTGDKGIEILSLIKEIDTLHIFTSEVVQKLQKENYDYVIDVQGLLKTALAGKLCLGKKLIGFKNTREFAHIFYDEKVDVGNLFKTKTHIVDLNLQLISSLNKTKEVKFLIPKICESSIIINSSGKKSALLFPSTTWDSKHWENDYWFELIKEISGEYDISILASKSEIDKLSYLTNKLSENNIEFNNLIGKTSIKDLIYLIQRSNLVIGLDSAGLHLASAIKNDFGSPNVIGIYGPTSILRNGPYKSIENSLYLSELNCLPCKKKICPLKHHDCMKKLLPGYVVDKLTQTSLRGA